MFLEDARRRKLRTSLTTLGVIVGIATIVALSSLGEGLSLTMRRKMHQGFEIDVLPVMAGGVLTGAGSEFTNDDLDDVRNVEGVVVASPIIQKTGIKPYDGTGTSNSTAWILLGVDLTDFWRIYPERLVFENGGLPESVRNDTAILGYSVQHPVDNETLAYPGGEVLLQISTVQDGVFTAMNYTFRVAGSLMERGATDFINFDKAIFVPFETVRELYDVENADIIMVKINNTEESDAIAKEIEAVFKPREVRVLVPVTFMQQVESILSMLERFHIVISSIALLVAGLGIMNIMAVTVMERTREIGVLKAIGAKDRTILGIFLAQASIFGLIAGLSGVPVGYVIAHVLSGFLFNFTMIPQEELITGVQAPPLTVEPILSIPWTIGAVIFGITVCIVFGWYPARKAARLDPVRALRYE